HSRSRNDSAEKRLTATTSSPVAGFTTAVPSAENTEDRIMTMSASPRNSQNGCGSLLPTLSMTMRARITGPSFSPFPSWAGGWALRVLSAAEPDTVTPQDDDRSAVPLRHRAHLRDGRGEDEDMLLAVGGHCG